MDFGFVQDSAAPVRRAMWFGLIVAAGAIMSVSFGCVTPFAALASLAALKLARHDAVIATGAVWACDQIVAFGWQGYPLSLDSAARGVAIGLSAIAAMFAAKAFATSRPAPLAVSLPFVAAFAAFESGLYAAGVVLPGCEGAFTAAVVRQAFFVNVATLCGSMALYQLAMPMALPARQGTPASVGL